MDPAAFSAVRFNSVGTICSKRGGTFFGVVMEERCVREPIRGSMKGGGRLVCVGSGPQLACFACDQRGAQSACFGSAPHLVRVAWEDLGSVVPRQRLRVRVMSLQPQILSRHLCRPGLLFLSALPGIGRR